MKDGECGAGRWKHTLPKAKQLKTIMLRGVWLLTATGQELMPTPQANNKNGVASSSAF